MEEGVLGAEAAERVVDTVRRGGDVRVKVEVRASTIPGAGDGLFALEDVPEGAEVGKYVGDVYGEERGKKMRPEDRVYFMRLGGTPLVFVDAGPHRNVLLRFVNDARDPERNNLRWDKAPHQGWACAVTTRAVHAGEEFFAPYGLWYWVNFDARLRRRVVHAVVAAPPPPRPASQTAASMDSTASATSAPSAASTASADTDAPNDHH